MSRRDPSLLKSTAARLRLMAAASLLVIMLPGAARAQWATCGTNSICNSNPGNVGVGTSTPGANLEVQSPAGDHAALKVYTGGAAGADRFATVSVTAAGLYSRSALNLTGHHPYVGSVNDNDFTAGLTLTDSETARSFRLALRPYTNSLNLFSDTLNNNGGLMTWTRAGLVGIGTASPGYRLDVQGGYTSSTSGYISRGNPWGTADSAFFPNGITTAGTVNWVYGTTTFINNAPSNGWGHQFQGASAYLSIGGGSVGVGTTTPSASYKLDVNGAAHVSGAMTVDGNISAKYQDVAEWVASSQKLAAGTVVVLDPERANQVVSSTEAYDTRVAGVVSAQPGIALGQGGEGKLLVATTGRVKVKVDATRAPVRIGDLLVTGEGPGTAMKSEPVIVGGRKIHVPGTIIGKALEPLAGGVGEILVLLSLQ